MILNCGGEFSFSSISLNIYSFFIFRKIVTAMCISRIRHTKDVQKYSVSAYDDNNNNNNNNNSERA